MYTDCIAIRGVVKCDDVYKLDKLLTKYTIMHKQLVEN